MKLLISITVAMMLSLGCAARPGDSQEIEPGGDVIVEPVEKETAAGGTSVAVTVSPEQFDEVARWFGTENSVTFSEPLHVERDGTTLDAKSGMKIDYTLTDSSGRFTFSKPWPTVKTNLLSRMVGGVSLYEVTLAADGSGVAKTGVGSIRLKWLDDGEAGAAVAEADLPEVWCYSTPGCEPCARAKRDFEESAQRKVLPFRAIWHDGEKAPAWMPSARPAFWWHISQKQPTQQDVANTRRKVGYTTLKQFLDTWSAERKQTVEAGGHQVRPFVRSRSDREIGSRSVAVWAIDGDSTPSRAVLLAHLTNDGIHRGRHDRQMLESLTTEQLRWLHDSDHGG